MSSAFVNRALAFGFDKHRRVASFANLMSRAYHMTNILGSGPLEMRTSLSIIKEY